jgi:hypothetical protein
LQNWKIGKLKCRLGLRQSRVEKLKGRLGHIQRGKTSPVTT